LREPGAENGDSLISNSFNLGSSQRSILYE
jgi:hypothetical protein